MSKVKVQRIVKALGLEAYYPFFSKSEREKVEETFNSFEQNDKNYLLNVVAELSDINSQKGKVPSLGFQSMVGYLCTVNNNMELLKELLEKGWDAIRPWYYSHLLKTAGLEFISLEEIENALHDNRNGMLY